MKRKILKITGAFLLFTGICIIIFPYIGQLMFRAETKYIIEDFARRTEKAGEYIKAEKLAGEDENPLEWLYNLMVEYNENLYNNKQNKLTDPFSYQQADFSLREFGFDDEMIGYITIPKMDTLLPIYLGANTANMKKGAAHLSNTSLPVGGANTNTVIAAHRNMSTATMFRDIEKLEIGDLVIITNFRETLYYKVAEIKVINPSDVEDILIQPGRDLATLITCHPYRETSHRYVVYCERA